MATQTMLCALILSSISACTSIPAIQESPSTTAMEPIAQPEWSVGYEKNLVNLNTGEPAGYKVIETDSAKGMRMTSNRPDRKGCQWTKGSDWFAPPTSWTDCGGPGEWSTATQTVELMSGGLWPLQAGAKAVYRRSPVSSAGRKGSVVTRKCEVSGPVTITVSTTDYDAMKVVCNSKRSNGHKEVRTWYWNAEHGEIKYRRTGTEKGLVEDAEIVTKAM